MRLRVGDFAEAIQLLAFREHLIEEDRESQFVTLAAGVSTDQIVKKLVEQGMALFEIALRRANTGGFLPLIDESQNR